jgi:hypothetical protein
MIYEKIPTKYLVNDPFMNLINHLYQMLIVANVADAMRDSLIDTEYDNDGDLVASGKSINVLTNIHDSLITNVNNLSITLNKKYHMILRDMTENVDNIEDDRMKVYNEVLTNESEDSIVLLGEKSTELMEIISPLLIDCNIDFNRKVIQTPYGELRTSY